MHGSRADLDSPLKTEQERLLEARASSAIAEYRLVQSGVASYQELGYRLPGDVPPAVKLVEYLVIDGEFNAARRERRERERRLWRK